MLMFMKIPYLKSKLLKSKLKIRFFAICLSLIVVGCGGSDNNTSSSSPPASPLTCANDVQVCSAPSFTALYGGGVFYFNEATDTNQPIKIREGEKQTFYAVIRDADISSGESIEVDINIGTNNNLKDYFSSPLKMVPENIPSALANYTNAEGYEIFIFTLGEERLLDDRAVGEHEISVTPVDAQGLRDSGDLFNIVVVIENINDAPVISTLTPSGGVIASGENIFEVFEGGNDGTIRVVVDDADIQHGDIVGLSITGANSLANFISIDRDKLPQSDTTNNQVEFIVNIASDLLQDTNKGEYPLEFLVYDEFGGAKDRRSITLKVKNTDDASSVSYSAISGGVSKLSSVDGTPDIFAISEEQSGRIEVTIFDEDLTSNSQLEYAITGDAEIRKLLRAYRIKRSLPRGERKVTIGIAEGNEQLDDVDIGSYNLNLHVVDNEGIISVSYPFVLKVNNVGEQPNIIGVSLLQRIIIDYHSGFYKLIENVASSLSISVADEDFGNPQNQESIKIAIVNSTLPENFITIQQSEISSPVNIFAKNKVTFRVEFASPDDELVGEHNVTFSFTDVDGNIVLFEMPLEVRNSNDAPAISALTPSGGVIASGENIFEVFEGGDNGIIRVIVDDADIQHGDIIGLNITGANSLADFISIERDKLSQSDTTNNQVEFIVHIASDLMQDTNKGEYPLEFLVYDEFGGAKDRKSITLKVKNTDDASSVSYSAISGGVNKLGSVYGAPDTFAINEGQSGRIEVAIFDEDLTSNSLLEYAITGDAEIIKLLRAYRIKRSLPRGERKVTIGIAERHEQLNDAYIGSYNLSLHVVDDEGIISVSYPFVLKVNNVGEQLKIKKVSPRGGLIFDYFSGFYKLKEHATGSLGFLIEDEDFGSPQNQESINVTIMSSTLPNDFITAQQSEINYLDSSTGNRVTFIIEFSAPTNDMVGEHNITFSFADTNGNIVLYKRGFKIENINAAPAISTLTSSDGVTSSSDSIFEVFEGGDNGIIRVIVDDADIQHGDIITLNITSANLPAGVISIENNKLSQSTAINNQVEFIVHIASDLLQDTDIGEYPLDFLVYDKLGKAEDRRTITLKVKNTDDASSANYLRVSGEVNKLGGVDGIPDTFAISEGQSGRIEVAISDEDLPSALQLEYTITGDSIRAGLLNITKVESLSSAEEHILFINVGKNGSPIDDADVGSYNLNLQVADAARTVSANYSFILKVNNSNDAPVISALTSSGGVGRAALPVEKNTFIVSEGGINGTIKITVNDPDIQHGDIVSLDISNNVLLGDSAFIGKYFSVESNIAAPNQVEFTIHIASDLLQDTDIGEHHFQLSVYDSFGESATRDLIVIVEDTNDLTAISNVGWTGNLTRISQAPSNERDLFTIYEGQSGEIEFTLSDEDLARMPLIVSNITGDSVDSQIISTAIRTKPSSPDERILTINIGSDLIDSQQIDDEHIGTYELNLNISGSTGEVEISYPFTLQIINVEEQPRIIEILPVSGAISATDTNSFILTQDVAAVFSIVVEDEDFAYPQNQENITIAVSHPFIENHPFLTLLSYDSPHINLPDTAEGKRATFVVNIAAPSNDFVGENILSITAIDSSAQNASLNVNLNILNVNDAPRIVNITSSGSVRRSDGHFIVAEEASPNGRINVIVEDIDFISQDSISLTVASATLDAKFISVAKAHIDESDADSNHQVTFNIDIQSELLNDAEVGTHALKINATDAEGVIVTRQVDLVVENVNDAPRVVSFYSSGRILKTPPLWGLSPYFPSGIGGKYLYKMKEGNSGAFYITIEDEDLIHSHESITIGFNNPFSDELLSFNKMSFSSADAFDGGKVDLVIRLGEDADFDDGHVGQYILSLSISDSTGSRISASKSRIVFEITNVAERPVFTQDSHDIAIFEQSYAGRLPAGTVVATIGEEYCSGIYSNFGCGFSLPILRAASDPDAGDTVRYSIESIDVESFYIDGLQIKTLYPLYPGHKLSFRLIAQDSGGRTAVKKPLVNVWIRRTSDPNQDYDNDGVRDPYDGAPTDPTMQTIGRGTHDDPYLIHNIYQLQAIAGVDHKGDGLKVSEFTGNSYLYGDEIEGQLSSHYRLANDVDAFSTVLWNSGNGFTPIGVDDCNLVERQCDAATLARRISAVNAYFSGTFDGANFKISGLTINRQSSYIGLFGAAGDGSVITNLTLTSADIINPATRSNPSHAVKFSHGGVLVGQMLGGTIDNIRVAGTLTGVGSGYGGVVGSLRPSANKTIPGIIRNSMADVDITANGIKFGGLVGFLGSNSFIRTSNAKGDVRSVVNNNAGLITNEAGRLIGFSFGDIFASETGGLVGVSYGNIFASYALGDVRGFHYTGGLVGIVQQGTTTASFAAGDVEGVKNVGGLFGAVLGGTHRYLYYGGQLVRSSYISELSDSIGGIVGKIERSPTIHTVINMRSSYPNEEVWKGGLIFGRIDMRRPTTRPQIYDAYTIDAAHTIDSPNRYLGYLLHTNNPYPSTSAPLSYLGGRYWTIRKLLERQLKDCGIDRTSPGDTSGCRAIFPAGNWGENIALSSGSYFALNWAFRKGDFPTLRVQPIEYWYGDGTSHKGSSILPSHEEQRCYIEPQYTHPTYCPTTLR